MNTLKEKGSRIWFWDNVKFIMILLVVVGHITEKKGLFGMHEYCINQFIHIFLPYADVHIHIWNFL